MSAISAAARPFAESPPCRSGVASSAYLHLFDEHQDADPAQRVTAEEAIRQGRVRTGYWKSAEANGA